MKFYSTVRLEVRKGEPIKQGTEIIGNRVKIKVAKNKVAPPFKVAEFDLIYGEGFSRVGSILDMGVYFEVISKSGAYFSFNGEKLGQGKDNAKKYLREHPEIADAIDAKIWEEVKKSKKPPLTSDPEEDGGAEEEETFDGEE